MGSRIAASVREYRELYRLWASGEQFRTPAMAKELKLAKAKALVEIEYRKLFKK